MRNKSRARSCFSEEDLCCLAERLTGYARTLPEREKHAFYEILLRAMEPLDRFRYLRPSDLLDSEEEAILRSLEKGSQRG